VSHILAVDPPLRLHQGLDDVTGLGAERDSHGVIDSLNVETLLFESLQDGNAGVEALHSREFTAVVVQSAVVVQNVDELEAVAFSDFVIIEVVGGGHLDSSGTESHVDNNIVQNNWDPASREGVNDELAVEVLFHH
jgi:hypothetical protein